MKAKALGFTGSLVAIVWIEQVSFFYDLDGFGGPVQPNLQYHEAVFSEIDTYGAV
ncbi:hypothetical protein J5I95_12020 [Candidatus Poribacteria bacterium]|nr:hypothetical protein [Candidatus Poribacteria bacterium]